MYASQTQMSHAESHEWPNSSTRANYGNTIPQHSADRNRQPKQETTINKQSRTKGNKKTLFLHSYQPVSLLSSFASPLNPIIRFYSPFFQHRPHFLIFFFFPSLPLTSFRLAHLVRLSLGRVHFFLCCSHWLLVSRK